MSRARKIHALREVRRSSPYKSEREAFDAKLNEMLRVAREGRDAYAEDTAEDWRGTKLDEWA